MKFFIDSASIDEIKEAGSLGLLDGVTTNPTLISKIGKSFDEIAKSICSFVEGPVSLEVIGLTADEMVAEGKSLRKYGNNVVVKIPMTTEGLKAVKRLSDEGIPTNVTLIFQPLQALLAAKAGASYVSPFIGRLDDIGHEGLRVAAEIIEIYQQYDFETEVLIASVRHPIHVLNAAKMGADIVTLPLKVVKILAQHPLTDLGLKIFLDDWQKIKK